MKILILIVIILIIIITFNKESFEVVSSNNYKHNESPYKPSKIVTEQEYNFGPRSNTTISYQLGQDSSNILLLGHPDKYIDELSKEETKNINCCLINKELGTYNYTKLNNKLCDSHLYDMDSNQQLMIDGHNDWNNDMCSSESKQKIGSCRFANKECIDFVTADYCKKYNMAWSEKTCMFPLDFVFKDRVNLILPELADDGAIDFFPDQDTENKK